MLQNLTVTAACMCEQKLQCMWLQHTLVYSKPGTTATPCGEVLQAAQAVAAHPDTVAPYPHVSTAKPDVIATYPAAQQTSTHSQPLIVAALAGSADACGEGTGVKVSQDKQAGSLSLLLRPQSQHKH